MVVAVRVALHDCDYFDGHGREKLWKDYSRNSCSDLTPFYLVAEGLWTVY
jgi:hypothetical protein